MSCPIPSHRSGASRRATRGFTLIEVLVSLVVFAIAVVGLVAMESRSLESQRASADLREAERVAQDVMGDLQARGFIELLAVDFQGSLNPSFPYDDSAIDPAQRLRDFRRPPADVDPDTPIVGELQGRYLVERRVDLITDPTDPPTDPPTLPDPLDPDVPDDLIRIPAVALEVTVLWIDDTNPNFPPPAGVQVIDLSPEMADPTDPAFQPYVGSVQLRTIRVNDAPRDPE